MALLTNINRKKGRRAVKAEEFMPKDRSGVSTARPQTVEEQRGVLKNWFAWAKRKGKTKKG